MHVVVRRAAVVLGGAPVPEPAGGRRPARHLLGPRRRVQVGRAIAGATVSIAGLPGAITTDVDGRFTLAPAPPTPFHLVVVLPGGQVAKPVIIERWTATGPCRSMRSPTSP